MNEINLFKLENENIKVTVDACIEVDGSLVVEGYDIGKTVQDYWGDIDYEYSVTVSAAEMEKLYALLHIPNGDRQGLLKYLRDQYHTNTCYSEIRDYLDKNGIRSEGFSWT